MENQSLLTDLRAQQGLIAAHRAAGLNEYAGREEADLLNATRALDEHPDGYDGPCECATCMSYD